MKPILIALLACLAIGLVGCSAGETTQDQIEKDAKAITKDPNATPVENPDVSNAPPMPTPDGGKQYGKKPANG
jgi:PBP1b-binding outer membrane lipoprotein LpoB